MAFPIKYGLGLNKHITVGDAILGDLPNLKSDQEKTEYISKPKNNTKVFKKKFKNLLNHNPNHPDETILKIKNTKPGEPMYPKFKQRIRLNKNN